jgi:hypothetical protein
VLNEVPHPPEDQFVERPRAIELVIGYSFGISLASAPGPLNDRIARHMAQEVSLPDGNRFVGVQWELEEALRRIEPHHSSDCVVPPGKPPFFGEEDILCLDQLKDAVREHEALTRALEKISLHPNLQDIFRFKNRAASYLNCLLHDTALFRHFGSLPLKPLEKKKNGRTWVESRVIPPAATPDLGMYQAQRVNRLILESVTKEALKESTYVGTIDVAEAVLKAVRHRDLTIARVRVYGHPAHVKRCRVQTLESAWKFGLRLDPSRVNEMACGDSSLIAPDNWDPNNAQEWVQSWENLQEHDGI